MALPTSGPLSLNDIAGEFGGTTPHSISEYYGVAAGIPTSGTISIADFYGASAISWDLSTLSYTGKSYNIGTNKRAVNLSTDKTKLIIGDGYYIYNHTMSTPGDISTATYTSISGYWADASILGNPQIQVAQGWPYNTQDFKNLRFKSDGTKAYFPASGRLYYTYNLATPWDTSLASMSYAAYGIHFNNFLFDIAWRSDGLRYYLLDRINASIYQGFTSNPFVFGPGQSYTTQVAALYSRLGSAYPLAFVIKPDGTKVFISHQDPSTGNFSKISDFSLSTPWDFSTLASTATATVDLSAQSTEVRFYVPEDGKSMYVINRGASTLYQYSM